MACLMFCWCAVEMTSKKSYFVQDINVVFFAFKLSTIYNTSIWLYISIHLSIYFILFIFFTMNLKEALSKFQEVVNNLEFARELQKSFLSLGQEVSLLKTPSKMYTLLLSFYFLFSKPPL